jgi:hypothetical protein
VLTRKRWRHPPPGNWRGLNIHFSRYDLREIGASNPGTPGAKGLQKEPET